MKLFLSSLTAIMLISIFASAQSNYVPGYYLTLKGDTLRGLINYKEWSLNPEIVEFKNSLQAKDNHRFDPSLVKGFGITNDDTYRSFTGTITEDELGNTNGRDTSTILKSVFLKLLLKGDNVSLFEYTDKAKKRYFIANKDAAPTELIYRSYQQNDQTIDERTYRKQLSVIASNSDKLDNDLNMLVQRTEYDEGSLIKVARKLNGSVSERKDFGKQEDKLNFYVGLNANVMMYRPDAGIKTAGAPNSTSVLPGITAGLNIYVNPKTRQVVLRVEAGAAPGRYYGAYTSKQYPYNDAVLKFNQLNVYVAPQILYNFYNSPNTKAFVGAGLQAYLITYSGRKFTNRDGTGIPLATQPFEFLLKNGTAILFKAGLLVNKRYEINGGYTIQSDIAQDVYYTIRATGAHIGVNYLF